MYSLDMDRRDVEASGRKGMKEAKKRAKEDEAGGGEIFTTVYRRWATKLDEKKKR